MSALLPDCMMPDGADPCAAFTILQEGVERQRTEIARLRCILINVAMAIGHRDAPIATNDSCALPHLRSGFLSNRSMLEFNHDLAPHGPREHTLFLEGLTRYLRSGDPKDLPDGVTYFGMRHHSDPCPLGDPPRGWHNEK